jgi:predicted metal-dependent hydrolase
MLENGYWTKFEAYRVEPCQYIPHGISYSLTLHDRYRNRVIGFDNAHAVKPKKKKFGARKLTWDHRHQLETVATYEFASAAQLLEDFWAAVDRYLGEHHG